MPTLRTNRMLSTDSSQELHTFCKSTEILQDSHSQEITFDQTAAGLLSHQNVCSITEVSGDNIAIAEVNFFQDESNAASTSFLPVPLLSCDPRSMVQISAPYYSSDLETVFSPNPKNSDSQLNSMDHSSTATDENNEFLHLILSGSDEGYSTSEFHFWDVLDVYFSESLSTVHFDSLMGFTNDASTSYNDCMNIVDMTERPVALPYLNKTEEADNANDEALVDHTTFNSDDTCFYLQTKPSDLEDECKSASCDVLPESAAKTKHVTLVLDLDETLVHSTLEHSDNADFTLQVFFNMKDHTVYVRRRPHLKMFLDKVAQMFELVIFTASQRIYAEQLIDKLDPDGKLISRRFYRESCLLSDGSYTKDLTILGVDLAKVAIIDNTPQVFQLQMDNGIPIKSWFDDPSDHELVELLPFLESLVDAEDVRPIISKTFNSKLPQN